MSQNFLRKQLNRVLNQAGFTVAEITVVAFIASFVSLAAFSLLIQAGSSQKLSRGDANVVQTAKLFGQWVQRNRSASTTRSCAQILQLNSDINTTFNPSAQTDVLIAPSATEVYKQGSLVGGASGFKIERIYLDDVTLATDLGAKKLYVASIYLKTSQTNSQGMLMPSRARSVAAVALSILSSNNSMESCNIEPTINSQELCSELAGMVWNAQAGKCDQAIVTAGSTAKIGCAPGFVNKGGVCKPIPTNCKGGHLAKSFQFSQVVNCEAPPTPVVAKHLTPGQVVAEGAPIPVQTVAAEKTFVTATGAAATVSAPAAASTTAAASCIDGTALGEATFNPCFNNSTYSFVSMTGINCTPQTTTPAVAGPACATRSAETYTRPALTSTVQPSAISDPADTTCTCNSRKINAGEFCMYCVADANLGFGDVDFAYGVSECTGGNLVPVPNPGLEPTTCTNNYARARRLPNSKFEQYNELY